MTQYRREFDTPFGGRIGIGWDGVPVVLRRDFGLTTEEECSEEAHAQMLRWWKDRNAWVYDPAFEQTLLSHIRLTFVVLPPDVPVTVGILTALEVQLGQMVEARGLAA